MPQEFIFVFIRYFIGAILMEKSCQKWRFGEKRGNGHIGGLSLEGGVQTFCTLWYWEAKRGDLRALNYWGGLIWKGRPQTPLHTMSLTPHMTSSLPSYNSSNIPMLHFFLFFPSPLIKTTSPTSIFIAFLLCIILCLSRRGRKYSFFPSFPCCVFALIDITLASFYFWSIFIYPIFWNHCRLPTKQSIRAWFERGDLGPLFIPWAWHRVWHRLYPFTIFPLSRCSTFLCFSLHLWLRPHLALVFSPPLCYASYCAFLEGVTNTIFPSFPCCFFALIDIALASFYFWSIFIYPFFWNHYRLLTQQSIRC